MSVPAIVLDALDMRIDPAALAPPVSHTVWGVKEGQSHFRREDVSAAQVRGLLPALMEQYEVVLVYKVAGGVSTLLLRYDVDGIQP